MNPIYFDNAATTPLLPEVVARMQKVLANQFGNPSSVHGTGR
ncbi:MAG: aminotransferase class V-fold PLP-dependent enzyme, partial [Flavobacteriaceae bacterium]